MRPSIEVASFSATNGRSVCCLVKRKGAFCAAAASASKPIWTSIPARFRTSAPPRASGSGSRTAATTRRTPAARMASVHGGVLPWCAQGSRVTTSVAPRAWSPAATSAFSSAWGPPNSACHPSATMSWPRNTTAPTMGFGETRPQPRQASSRARRIASSSLSLSFFKPNRRSGATRRPDFADDPRRNVRARGRADDRLDIIACHHSDHADAEIEHALHLVAPDVTGAHEDAEERWPRPAPRVDGRLYAGRQPANEIARDAAPRDVREGVDVVEHRPDSGGVAPVDREEDLSHRLAGLGKRIVDLQLHRIEHDLPRQGVAVGVQTRGCIADQLIAGCYAVSVEPLVFLDHADDRPGEIVVT